MAPAWRVRAATSVALFLESCTLFLVFASVAGLAKLEQLQMPFWLVLLSLVWGFCLSYWILSLKVTPVLRGLVGLLLGVPSLLVLTAWNAGMSFLPFALIVPVEAGGIGQFVGSIIFLLIIWWRGAELSREDTTLDSVRSAFQAGMVTLLVAAIIDAATEGSTISGFLVVGFFAVGLMGMALARFSADGDASREMSSRWLWPIAACVAGVLATGLLISGLGLGGLDDVTRTVTGVVASLGFRILEPIIFLVGLLAGALVNVGNWVSGFFGGGDIDGLLQAQNRIDQFHESLREAQTDSGGNALFTVLQWVAAALGALVAAGVVYWLFRNRRRTSGAGEVFETRESLFSLKRAGDEVGDAIGGLLPGMWGRRGRQSRVYRSPRDYYHALLDQSDRAGRPRSEWETPREHQRGLSGRLPADPVARIVDEFQASHYGAESPDSDRMEGLEEDRLAIEDFLREQRREG